MLSLSVWGCNVGCLLGTLVLILVLSPFVVTFLQGLSLHVVSVSCSSVLKHMASQGSKKVSRNLRPLVCRLGSGMGSVTRAMFYLAMQMEDGLTGRGN